MEVSAIIKTTQLVEPSPCGNYLATLHGMRLEIRTIELERLRYIDLTRHDCARFLQIKWSPVDPELKSSVKLLLANEDVVRVWDMVDEEWSAKVGNGSGGMGKIANVEFGRDAHEILVFSSFGASMAVWSLATGRFKEIRSPKFTRGGHGWNRARRETIFAILQRPAAQDMVTIYAAGSWNVLATFELTTVDAQGLKWSPDGRWLTVWDAPSAGFKVYVYTADGILYRTYMGDASEDTLAGLGVRSIEWSPSREYLAVGGFEHIFTLLNTRTFSPTAHLAHSQSLEYFPGKIWQEQATAHKRSYAEITGPINLPAAATPADDSKARHGVSTLAFNVNGSLLATKDDRMPTTVWIWDVRHMHPHAVIIQHSLVKHVTWHPSDPKSILIQCNQEENFLYVWHATNGPRVLNLSATMLTGKTEARWIQHKEEPRSAIMLGSSLGFILVDAHGGDAPTAAARSSFGRAGPAVLSDTESDFNIPLGNDSPTYELGILTDHDLHTANCLPDDTFKYRKGKELL